MRVVVDGKLVGADCAAPCRMAFPPQELYGFADLNPST